MCETGPFIADRGRGNFAHYTLSLVVGKKTTTTHKGKNNERGPFSCPFKSDGVIAICEYVLSSAFNVYVSLNILHFIV